MDMEIYEKGKEIFNYLKDNFRIYTVEECKQLEKDKGAYGVIYITQCKVNSKLYIGQKKIDTNDFATYLGSGVALTGAVKKYGKENFERIILQIAYSKEELDDFEIKYIRLFDASEKYNRDLFYNRACGGDGGNTGAYLKGKDSPLYGRGKPRIPRIKAKCDYCGKEVERLESEIKNKSNIFCSRECQHKWRGEHLRGKDSPLYKQRTKVKCDYCGKELERLEWELKNNKNNFCNQECFGKWLSEQMRGREDKKGKDSSLYKGFVAIYPNGEVSKDMTRNEMMNFLGVGEDIIRDLVIKKNCYTGTYEHIKYIRVLHLEDYLEEREIYKSDEDFRNMCKQMVEKAKKKKSEAKKERRVSLICIFPSGKIIKDICISELTKELGVNKKFVKRVLDSHKRYKAPNRKGLERLKQFDGMIIMYQKDYLNIIANKYCKFSKAS